MRGNDVLIIYPDKETLGAHAETLQALLSSERLPARFATAADIAFGTKAPGTIVICDAGQSAYSAYLRCRQAFPAYDIAYIVAQHKPGNVSFEKDTDNPREMLLTGAFDAPTLVNYIKKATADLAPAPAAKPAAQETPSYPPQAHIITVFSAKGGVGKTTIATNLALAIQQKKKGAKVLLFDANLEMGDTAMWLGLKPKNDLDIMDLLGHRHTLDEVAVRTVVHKHESGIDVLLPPKNPVDGERVQPESIKSLITLLKTMYDYIVIDTHSSYSEMTLAALDLAHDILVIMQPEISVLRNTLTFFDLSQLLGYNDKLRVVLNRCNTGFDSANMPDHVRKSICANVPSDGKSVVWSVNSGKPFMQTDPKLPVSREIDKLATLLVGEPVATTRRVLWPFGGKR